MMRRHLLAACLAFAIAPSVALAQNASPSKPDEARPVSTANIQIQVAIADYVDSAPPTKKAVSMIVADGTFGRMRSSTSNVSPTLNVDAFPRLNNGRIELRLTVEYRPPAERGADVPAMPISETMTVLLDSGKPLVVAQAADPSVDRRVTVEVTATILK
jgi:hypothetical protein